MKEAAHTKTHEHAFFVRLQLIEHGSAAPPLIPAGSPVEVY
jgi:hypothetical protein